MSDPQQATKKELILKVAREIGAQEYTPAEIDQVRRKLIAEFGEDAKTGNEYSCQLRKRDSGFLRHGSLQGWRPCAAHCARN